MIKNKDLHQRIARLEAENDILKNESLLNNLTKHLPGVVYQYRLYPDGHTSFPYSSPGMWNIYELTPDELKEDASPVKERIHPDDFCYVFDKILESAKNQTVYECEFRVILPEQGLRWRYCSAMPELMPDGGTLWHGIITDITGRKEIEQQLEIKNSEFNSFFDCALDLLCIADLEGNIIRLNGEWENVLGFGLNELIGLNYVDLIHNEDIKSTVSALKLLSDKSRITTFINRLKCKAGGYKWIEWRLYQSGDRIYGSARDITDRIETEEMLIKAKNKAEEGDRLKTAFLQNLSHEIRTPMNAIMGFSSLLPNYFDDRVKLQHFTKIINQRCYDLLDIINDILDIAKIESRQLSLNLEVCSVKALFGELKVFFTEKSKITKPQIRFELEEQTGIEDFKIITDYLKLKQVLINLISNSFKFTEEGSITGTCSFEGDKVKFCISDTGIGIPLDKKHLIFGRFSNLQDERKKIYDGTGLGLSIVKGMTEILGGEVWFDSQEGKGSSFYFTIRYVGYKSGKYEKLISGENKDQKGKKVLVVEDDIYYSALIRETLTDMGLNLIFVDNAMDAISYSLKEIPDIILMDACLPDMSGYEAIRQILKKNPSVKIIAQTAGTEEGNSTAMNSGCIASICKPISQEELLSVLKEYL